MKKDKFGNTVHEHPIKINDEFDSTYCELCDEWIEEKCGDRECGFCSKRPKRPSMVTRTNEEYNS